MYYFIKENHVKYFWKIIKSNKRISFLSNTTNKKKKLHAIRIIFKTRFFLFITFSNQQVDTEQNGIILLALITYTI